MHDPVAAQREIIEEFGFFDDWLDRYQYLIDLGRKLPPLKEKELLDRNLLDGCQSRVWLLINGDAAKLNIRANSDAAIVSGLIALLIRVYSGASAQQILDSEPRFIAAIGLSEHLSPTRANGLHAMVAAIRGAAAERLEPATQ
jgi:cysteine desulfuration protein SufE